MLADSIQSAVVREKNLFLADLHLAICPSWDLNDHVQDGLLLVGVERNIVEGRDGNAILLNEHTVLESVGGTDLADRVSHIG